MSEKWSGELPTKKILVYGWYHQGNLGDELFIEAFTHLFPSYQFTFTEFITTTDLQQIDGVFIGGGSFLSEPLNIADEAAFELLKQQKICYLGVGAETNLHSTHHQLLSLARLIAVRTPEHLGKVQQVNPNVMVIPDLVYALSINKRVQKINKSVLILPNITVVPRWNDPAWKHAAWNYFKSEFAQFLDEVVSFEWTVDFMPMCVNPELNDASAALELVNATQSREKHLRVYDKPADLQSAVDLMSQYQVVITQRYHGIILSNMIGIPYIAIHHHDKLKSSGADLSFYGASKAKFWYLLENHPKVSLHLPIDRNIFTDLTRRVDDALCRD